MNLGLKYPAISCIKNHAMKCVLNIWIPASAFAGVATMRRNDRDCFYIVITGLDAKATHLSWSPEEEKITLTAVKGETSIFG